MKQNQHGLTLIEVLATLSILSIAGVLIWGIYFQGANYSKKAVAKNQMQQEANIIIAKLTGIHQKVYSYQITNTSSGKITVIYKNTDTGSSITEILDQSGMDVSVNVTNKDGDPLLNIKPNEVNPYVTLTIKDQKNPDNNISVDFILYRLKGGD